MIWFFKPILKLDLMSFVWNQYSNWLMNFPWTKFGVNSIILLILISPNILHTPKTYRYFFFIWVWCFYFFHSKHQHTCRCASQPVKSSGLKMWPKHWPSPRKGETSAHWRVWRRNRWRKACFNMKPFHFIDFLSLTVIWDLRGSFHGDQKINESFFF